MFERYIHDDSDLSPLIRIAMLHVQIETIHPYLDGNGRIGRLLATLLFEHWKLLNQPLLHLSLFLKRHRAEYYRLLNGVRTEVDFESWTSFFLEGVAVIATEAVATTRALFEQVSRDRAKVLRYTLDLGRGRPVVRNVARIPDPHRWQCSAPAEHDETDGDEGWDHTHQCGVLVETSGRRRDRTFCYAAYLNHLRTGTELDTRRR